MPALLPLQTVYQCLSLKYSTPRYPIAPLILLLALLKLKSAQEMYIRFMRISIQSF